MNDLCLLVYVIGSLGMLFEGNSAPKLFVLGKIIRAVVSMISQPEDNFGALINTIREPITC